jgi:hypothetical protein
MRSLKAPGAIAALMAAFLSTTALAQDLVCPPSAPMAQI